MLFNGIIISRMLLLFTSVHQLKGVVTSIIHDGKGAIGLVSGFNSKDHTKSTGTEKELSTNKGYQSMGVSYFYIYNYNFGYSKTLLLVVSCLLYCSLNFTYYYFTSPPRPKQNCPL